MIAPGAMVMFTPLLTGTFFGVYAVCGLLVGSLVASVQLAISMSNSGGAWDNAKKYIERASPDSDLKGKGSDVHKAAVVGDTVGDPFKDTSGPALNILIKLMSMVSLVIAPLINGNGDWDDFYYGFIPMGLLAGGSYVCYVRFWKNQIDITADIPESDEKQVSGRSER